MGLWSVITGSNAALDAAEKALVQWEDKLFQAIPNEDIDLTVHVRADVERFQALNIRARVNSERAKSHSDRNMIVMTGGFVLILAKLFGFLDVIVKALSLL